MISVQVKLQVKQQMLNQSLSKMRVLETHRFFSQEGNETLAAQYFMLAAKKDSAEARCLFYLKNVWPQWQEWIVSIADSSKLWPDGYQMRAREYCCTFLSPVFEAQEIVGQLLRTGTGVPQDQAWCRIEEGCCSITTGFHICYIDGARFLPSVVYKVHN